MRRSNRIEEDIPITLIGSDTEGRSFLEHTHTILISLHGAGIVSQYKLSPEQELLILLPASNHEANVRIIGQMGVRSELYIYGVGFLEPLIDFWGREFTSQPESESKAPPLILECSRCGSRESVEHNDLEIDVFTFNQNVVRYCQACASSTVWKISASQINDIKALEQRDAPSLPSTAEVLAGAPASASSPSNKRKHRRTKVDFAACIRRPGFKDDIVVCEDMSRGGVRFTSSRVYFADTAIEIAVPYSKGSSSIFVPAQVSHVQQLPKRKLFLCGVAFTKFNN